MPPIGPAPPPPPPPPVTALAEMGFSLNHIQQGIRALNLNANGLNATQIAMLGREFTSSSKCFKLSSIFSDSVLRFTSSIP